MLLDLDVTFERHFGRAAQPDVLPAPRPVYPQLAPAHLHPYLRLDEAPTAGDGRRCARAGTAGERLAGAALVDAQLQVRAVDDLEEAGVHPARETRVALDGGPERGDGRSVHRLDREHRVRIAERNRADRERAALDLERVRVGLRGRLEGERAGIEVRHAHVDRDAQVRGDARGHHPGGTVE